MFMRISRGRVREGQWQAYEDRYKALAAEPVGPAPKARWLARDLDDPEAGYAVSLWASESDMRAYSQDPAVRSRIEQEFAEIFTGQYQTKLCEVRHMVG